MVSFAPDQSFQEPLKYVHQATGDTMVKVSAGDVYATVLEEYITTVLGSCVTVCIRSRRSGIGGINHFMLPGSSDAEPDNARYGVVAIERLIRLVLDLGARADDLEAKVFGGASVIKASSDIGAMNVGCAFEELSKRRVPIIASDVGLGLPRKIIFDPRSGRVQLLRLRIAYQGLVWKRERESLDRILAANGGRRSEL